MSQKFQNQLKEVGLKLQNPPISKDALIKLLKQTATCLSELDQSPSPSVLESMRFCIDAIVKPEFLKHHDRDVKLLVATCICEITRITAPEAPYSDDVLRDIFCLIVGTFSGLSDVNGPSFGRRVVILEALAKYRSCVVMLDLECDDLVNEIFSTFLSVARDDHPERVLTSMQTIMILLIEESEDIQENLLVALLSALGRAKTGISMAARKLAMNVIEHCAAKLESCIKKFLISSMTGDRSSLTTQLDYHEVIFDIFCCAPLVLSGVIPYLTGELLSDHLDTRLKTVKLLGDLFTLPDCVISEPFLSVFSEFLKRLTDRAVEVRMSVVDCVKRCLLSKPFKAESPQIIAALSDRLFDYDENVRKEVVAAVCDVACCTLKSIPVDTLQLVSERLRDKSLLVKRYTMERIAEIFRLYCLKCSDVSVSSSEFEWIPGKILRCFYDKDVREETIEVVLCGSLFPKEFSTNEKVKHWITVFSGLEKVEVKALEKMLEQKQRLQQEMQKYLSLRQMVHQENDAPTFQKIRSFRSMSRSFVDPTKAEKSFEILDQLKDANVWKILSNLLDPNTSFQQACTYREELPKILGEKHPLYDFVGTLSMKCSYLLFNKECVKEILLEVDRQKSAGNTQRVQFCMNLLVILAQYSPTLLSGTEEHLVNFIKEDDEIIKEGALHILAKAGGTIREQLAKTSSSVELMLERLCLEGSRKQAKYAVYALAAITKDDGLRSLSVLYKRLVDMLEEKTHLPAIFQSLGCIAQIAMPIFETRESEIVGFVTSSILECSNKAEDTTKSSWEERSELCVLKIYGLKTLVKSYLPVKDPHLRHGIENLLGILQNILLTGEVSIHVKSSTVDKAHMKLASAKAILRLSYHWDGIIPVDVFHLTIRTPEVKYPEVKKQFLGKVMQYIKDRVLDAKYACAFPFKIVGSEPPELEEEKHNLVDIIQMSYQGKVRQMQCDSSPSMTYPEYIVPYLVHALAHHSSCPDVDECRDVKAFEPMYLQLHFFLSVLVDGDEDGKSEVSNKEERIRKMMSIFRSIKYSEDVFNVAKSKNSHAAAELGLLITKHLAKKEDFTGLIPLVPLPSALYRPFEKNEVGDSLGNGELSWLAGASALAHFESLKLESHQNVSDNVKDSKDDDVIGNDVPIVQFMGNRKAQGPKVKRVKKKVVPAQTKKAEKDDVIGVVGDKNLKYSERSKNKGSGNGPEYVPTGETDDQGNDEKVSVSENRKRRNNTDASPHAIPKRRRSSSGHNVRKSSRSWSNLKGMNKFPDDYFHDTEFPSSQSSDEEAHVNSEKLSKENDDVELFENDLLASCLPRNKNFSAKAKHKSIDQKINTEHIVDTGDADAKPNKLVAAHSKKRKRRSMAGLAKCSSKEGEEHKLVGCRIKVWWPLDKMFYEGVIESYNPGKKEHVVLYNDGDVEVLKLDKERWELIADGDNPKKLPNSPIISPAKTVSPAKKKNRTSSGSQCNKKSNNKSFSVRRKVSPKKSLNSRRSRGNSDGKVNACSDAESGRISDLANSGPVTTSKTDDTNSGDSARKQEEEREKFRTHSEDDKEDKSHKEGKEVENAGTSLTELQESDREDGSISVEKQVEETEKNRTDAEESEKESKSDSALQKQVVGGFEKKLTGAEESEYKSDFKGKDGEDMEMIQVDVDQKDKSDLDVDQKDKSDLCKSEATGYSDDEPLGMWKRRIQKRKAL